MPLLRIAFAVALAVALLVECVVLTQELRQSSRIASETNGAYGSASSANSAASPSLLSATTGPVYRDASAFAYAGSWSSLRQPGDARFPSGRTERSFRVGSSASLRFAGRFVRLYGDSGPTGGSARIAIDGRPVDPPANFFTPQNQNDVVVFSSPELTTVPHLLSIAVEPPAEETRERRSVIVVGVRIER